MSPQESRTKVVVVGSCMIDFVSYAARLPKEGETIHGTKFATNFGGKGANQCVAAAKLGAETYLVARVGDDVWGEKYVENLKNLQINTDFVLKTPGANSGVAQITVSESTGQNQIVIVAGANNFLTPQDLEDEGCKKLISTADVLVLQLETSPDVALKALQLCQGISILNGAPAIQQFPLELLSAPTIFCVNETEAAVFANMPVRNNADAKKAASVLISKGCKSVILTLGAEGLIYMDGKQETVIVNCPRVKCVDSTGAGDAFIGALSYLLANQKSLPMRKILEVACCIASDSVTRAGTQNSFPSKEILKNLNISV